LGISRRQKKTSKLKHEAAKESVHPQNVRGFLAYKDIDINLIILVRTRTK